MYSVIEFCMVCCVAGCFTRPPNASICSIPKPLWTSATAIRPTSIPFDPCRSSGDFCIFLRWDHLIQGCHFMLPRTATCKENTRNTHCSSLPSMMFLSCLTIPCNSLTHLNTNINRSSQLAVEPLSIGWFASPLTSKLTSFPFFPQL